MMVLGALAISVALAAQPTVSAKKQEPAESEGPASAVSVEDGWLLLQARDRIFQVGGEAWSGDIAAGIKDAPALSATDPVLRELEPLLRSIAGREPAGIASPQGLDQIPRPWWRFAWWNVDGDDKKDLVLVGGSSPAPYYAVLQRIVDKGHSWRVLHEARFRFLGSTSRAGRAYFFGVFDGYGVASPVLAIDSVATNDASGASKHQIRFDLLEWPTGKPEKDSIAVATATRVTKLRTAPRKDDKPADRGLNQQFPGNLFQTLAPGSTGWTLHIEKGRDGQDWALCCFVGTSPMSSEQPVKEMLVPRKLLRRPLTSVQNLLVGWVPTRDLAER